MKQTTAIIQESDSEDDSPVRCKNKMQQNLSARALSLKPT